MTLTPKDIDSRLQFFRELLSCVEQYYLWTYSASGRLQYTNSTDLILDKVFRYTKCYPYMMEYAKTQDHPLIMSESYGLLWVAVFEKRDGKLFRFHLLGPVYGMEPGRFHRSHPATNDSASESIRAQLIQNLNSIQILPPDKLLQQAIQLHFCITNEKLKPSDFSYQKGTEDSIPAIESLEAKEQYAEEYRALQGYMRMIKDGNLEYRQILSHSIDFFYQSSPMIYSPSNTLMNTKVNQVIFASCCKQSSIEGGLSTEKACSYYKKYIKRILASTTITDVMNVSQDMYDTYIRLVHELKASDSCSKPIQSCCDYIETHIYQKLGLEELASVVGYSNYYLSRRFKQEMGCSINDYIKQEKIRHAQILLSDTKMSIQEISDALCFGSRAFFSKSFREITGTTPASFRTERQTI